MQDISRLGEYQKENPNRLTEEQFEILKQEILHPAKETISDECLDFRFWCEGRPSRQEWFATYLKNEILPEGKLRILEVGSGRYPRLSLLLRAQGHSMTCMNPKAEPVKEEGIQVRREAFDWEHTKLCHTQMSERMGMMVMRSIGSQKRGMM